MDKKPNPEITRVHDLMGLISRKVIQKTIKPVGKDQPAPKMAPPVPLTNPYASIEAMALSVYNGWIPFDDWLNRPDTLWHQCRLVARVLSDQPQRAMSYLTACHLPADMQTAGYMRGKIAAMEAICLIRQIYLRSRQGTYAQPDDCKKDVTRFVRFVFQSANTTKVSEDMHTIARSSESLDEFELRWFATILPVNNLLHARRIFKTRVQKLVLNEYLSTFHQHHLEGTFGLYYFLGVMSRLFYFNLHDPYWTEATLRPLRNLFYLFSQAAGVDFDFIRQVFPAMIQLLQTRHSIKPEAIYIRFVAWLLYKNALKDNSLSAVANTLCIWEKELGVSIRSYPLALSMLYRDLAAYDLAYAEREVIKVIVINPSN